jgi:hypothetical protein
MLLRMANRLPGASEIQVSIYDRHDQWRFVRSPPTSHLRIFWSLSRHYAVRRESRSVVCVVRRALLGRGLVHFTSKVGPYRFYLRTLVDFITRVHRF